MKRKISLAIVALASFAIQSFAAGSSVYLRTIENPGTFGKIIIADNLSVMLVDEETSTIMVEGKTTLLNSVVVSNTYGVLTIKSLNKNTADKIVVYVPVKSLYAIEIGENSKVYSPDMIITPNLNVLVTGECKIGLQATGKITLQHTEDIDFTFSKVKNPRLLKTEIL